MAAHFFTGGFPPRALVARGGEDAARLHDGAEVWELPAGRSIGALGVAAGAMLLAAAPAVIAMVAIVNPGELNRIAEWLLGASAAFSLVAAGRVPAAALFAIVMARRPAES